MRARQRSWQTRRPGREVTPLVFVLALAMTLLMSAPALAADCGCTTTGPHKSPASKDLQIAADGSSPQNKYRVSASGTAQISLTIRRVATNAVVYSQSIPGGSQWGFSPDSADGTFVFAWVSGQSSVQLGVVNLASGALVRSETIIARPRSGSSARVAT